MAETAIHKRQKTTRPRLGNGRASFFPRSSYRFVDAEQIPSHYGVTQLTMMPRDPHSVHAYWEIVPADLDQLRKKFNGNWDRSSVVLRVYDITCVDFNGSNANHSFDLDVGLSTNNWYIDLWGDNASYVGELGVRTPEGQFFPMTRSNPISTPRASSSERGDLIWMNAQERADMRPYFMMRPQSKPYSLDKDQSKTAQPRKSGNGRRITLSEEDVRAYYAHLFPLLSRVRSRRRGSQQKAVAQRAAGAGQTGPKGLPDIVGQTYGGYRPEQSPPWTGSHGEWRKIFMGASAELSRPGASELLKREESGASERIPKPRKFFFELWTELLVYGRTEPDATVRHGQKEVKLRPDGTFSLRFALPDGRIPLDFMAESADKIDRRFITTAVERTKTIYGP